MPVLLDALNTVLHSGLNPNGVYGGIEPNEDGKNSCPEAEGHHSQIWNW